MLQIIAKAQTNPEGFVAHFALQRKIAAPPILRQPHGRLASLGAGLLLLEQQQPRRAAGLICNAMGWLYA